MNVTATKGRLAFGLSAIVLSVACATALITSSDSIDRDGDGIGDHRDNCPDNTNPIQENLDGDAFGNACDPDSDGDGFTFFLDDCDDLNNQIFPGGPEIADGLDNDCFGGIDNNAVLRVFPVRAISDNAILSDTVLDAAASAYLLTSRTTPGEFESMSFVVQALRELENIEFKTADLTAPHHTIANTALDMRVVKEWFQSGYAINDLNHKHRVPELLLKNDALIRNENNESFVATESGAYIKITDPTGIQGIPDKPTNDEFPIRDAQQLLPLAMPQNSNKQIWLNVNVPPTTPPGTYTGTIEITENQQPIGRIKIEIEVLPFELAEPSIQYSIYYTSRLAPVGTLSAFERDEPQIVAELDNLRKHGISNPTVYGQLYPGALERLLELRINGGFRSDRLYYLGLFTTSFNVDSAALANAIDTMQQACTTYGVGDLYIYGPDEETLDTPARRTQLNTTHTAGAKVFNAQSASQALAIADLLDLAVVASVPSRDLADIYHSQGHQIFSYANPQVGEERPETYRRNYGLLLWQKDYDGAMDFAYHYNFKNSWNDFDSMSYRDHNFVYPTVEGVIDTLAWEGFREGVDDVRYLDALRDSLAQKSNCCDSDPKSSCCPIEVLSSQNLLNYLKSVDLGSTDLDSIRSQIIEHILALRGDQPLQNFVTYCGNHLIESGEECDSENFAEATCGMFGYQGNLLCRSCVIDHSTCIANSLSLQFVSPTPQTGDIINGSSFAVSALVESPDIVYTTIELVADPDLLAYWKFDEGSGMIAADTAGNHHGTLTAGDHEVADTGTTTQKIKEMSTYVLKYESAYYNNWSIELLDGPGIGAVGTVQSFIVNNVQNNREILLTSPLTGLGEGVRYRLLANLLPPTFGPGHLGSSISFDGVDDYIDLGSNPALSELDTKAFTIAAWIAPNSIVGSRTIVSKNGPFFLMLTDGVPRCGIYTQTGGFQWSTATTRLATGSWRHVAASYDGSLIRLYVDGIEENRVIQNGDLAGNGCVQIGRDNNGLCSGNPTHYFSGAIDDVRIYRRTLSSSEIYSLAGRRIHTLSRDFKDASPGIYTFYVQAVDAGGNTFVSETRSVQIVP